ncbi:hypothetical protein P8452_56009 [Trifolium repens]|nr:hypothetical protein P8452_56009 [Trifolium repens]
MQATTYQRWEKQRKQQKRKNNLDEAGNINKMSKSRKCPTSDRRNLIPNSTTIFYRCCSLRSSRRLQTGNWNNISYMWK